MFDAVAVAVTDWRGARGEGQMSPGSSDVGPFKKWATFGFLCFPNNFTNLNSLNLLNLFYATAALLAKV